MTVELESYLRRHPARPQYAQARASRPSECDEIEYGARTPRGTVCHRPERACRNVSLARHERKRRWSLFTAGCSV